MSYDHLMPIPMNVTSKVLRCVCKIKYANENKINYFSGFFMRVSDALKYLISMEIFRGENLINKNIEIEIWNKKIVNMELNGRFIKNFEFPKSITVIEIKETDDIYKDVEFLDYDQNYHKGYEIYKDENIFSIHFPLGKEAVCASGKVININNDELEHNIPTDRGSGGCPILILSNNINSIKVIGVHTSKNILKHLNYATLIGSIINGINKPIKNENKFVDFDKNKIFYNNIYNNNIYIDNNINNNINNHKIYNPNNPKVNNIINYNNKIIPFNNNLNNINKNYIHNLNNNNKNPNIAPINSNPLFSSNISNNSIKSQNEKVLILTNDPNEAITLHFRSSNQLIKYTIRCKTHHKFNLIANQIFEREPNFVENGLLFLCGGRKVNEYKSIKDNQLKDGDVIIIQIME